nr:ribonuclease H-like domain-containing protein [Tanacetum cinerariifolium]
MDVKSAFLYEKIEKEVYVYQPSRFDEPGFPDKVYKVEKALYGLHQAPRACKAFRVFNNRTRIVEENLHIRFSENIPNIVGSGLNWLFDIDALTKSMNYMSVVARNQSNGNTSIKACDDAGKARMETIPGNDYILLPSWTADPLISQELKSSQYDGFEPSSDDGKKVDKDSRQE